MALPKPDWSDWLKRPKVTYWEAVALACDVDPYAVTYYLESKNSWWFGDERRDPWSHATTGLPKKQRRMLDALIAAGEDAQTRPFQVFYPVVDERADIVLKEFARFAVDQMNWDVPAKLADLANLAALPSPKGKWPWGDYESQNLRWLEQAVSKFWADWKVGDPEHLNKTVQAYLEELGMDPDPASQVATLIRPDSLKKGGRPRGAS